MQEVFIEVHKVLDDVIEQVNTAISDGKMKKEFIAQSEKKLSSAARGICEAGLALQIQRRS